MLLRTHPSDGGCTKYPDAPPHRDECIRKRIRDDLLPEVLPLREGVMMNRKSYYHRAYVNRTGSVNYLDTDAIVRNFNDCVTLYRRFETALLGGDDQLAANKLRGAGTTLFQVCEWSLKNYLHRRYLELEAAGQLSQTERISRTDDLQRRETTLRTLLDEFKDRCEPAYNTCGIHPDDILHAAQGVNNGPKHNADVPDPDEFKKALDGVRRLIRNYVAPDAELSVLRDAVYGEEKAWFEILDETGGFSKAYTYILVTRRAENLNSRGLFSLKWDMVIDFDPSTEDDGLLQQYCQCVGGSPRILNLDDNDTRKRMPASALPYWVFANGTSDDADSVLELHKWKNRKGKYLSRLLEKYHMSDPRPAVVFLYPVDDEWAVQKIVDSFNDAYDGGEDTTIFALSAESEYANVDADNFRISAMGMADFCENLARRFEGARLASGLIRRGVPAADGGSCVLEEAFYLELQDSFEVVYQDIAESEEKDAVKTSRLQFYNGEVPVSWYGIREQFDVIRKDKDTIIRELREDLKDHGRLLRHVYYEPGVGGTTLMRRVAFEMRGQSPCLILFRKNEQTVANIQKLYHMTKCPILIFADNNTVEPEDIRLLQAELKSQGFAFVICYFERKLRGQQPAARSAVITVVEELSEKEARQMQSRLADYIAFPEPAGHIRKIVDGFFPGERSPFIMSMYTFNRDFRGIKPYIANFLSGMNDMCRKILFAVALADYGNVSLSTQYFADLPKDDAADAFLTGQVPGMYELTRIERRGEKEYLKIRYPLFAEEILKQLSLGRDAQGISFLNLVDRILVFIEDSRKSAYTKSQDNLDVLRSLFITRIADEDSEKPAFSPLITRLLEEHRTEFSGRTDGAEDAVARILKKLVKVYPEEPHFTAHLARYYFYIDRDFEKGLEYIDDAIAMAEDASGKADPLLYHMKAMGYSSRITNKLIPEITKNLRSGFTEDNEALFAQLEADAAQAFSYFKLVRDANVGIAGHVSEINLCIHIANLAKNVLDESADFNAFLMTQKGNWALEYITRANDLWEECRPLLTENDPAADLEIRLKTLTADVGGSIGLWEEYIAGADSGRRSCARSMLARAYEKKNAQEHDGERVQQNLRRIIELMEDNLAEPPQNPGDIRTWFEAVRQLETADPDEVMRDASVKLNLWVHLMGESVEAHYYRFVLKFLQAVSGSAAAENELPGLLRELRERSGNLYNRTTMRHWLTGSGEGLSALVPNSREYRRAVPDEEMVSGLQELVGRVRYYVNDSHAYIRFRGVDVYFNPSATKGEIDATKVNQRVKFGIGFSYDGPRAYNASIRLLGKDDVAEQLPPLSTGMIVRCEVVRNVAYFTQVRLLGYDAAGSIHISEYNGNYSAEHRPGPGDILEVKLLGERFVEKQGKNMWMLSMDTKGADRDSDDGETEFARQLKNLKLV